MQRMLEVNIEPSLIAAVGFIVGVLKNNMHDLIWMTIMGVFFISIKELKNYQLVDWRVQINTDMIMSGFHRDSIYESRFFGDRQICSQG